MTIRRALGSALFASLAVVIFGLSVLQRWLFPEEVGR